MEEKKWKVWENVKLREKMEQCISGIIGVYFLKRISNITIYIYIFFHFQLLIFFCYDRKYFVIERKTKIMACGEVAMDVVTEEHVRALEVELIVAKNRIEKLQREKEDCRHEFGKLKDVWKGFTKKMKFEEGKMEVRMFEVCALLK